MTIRPIRRGRVAALFLSVLLSSLAAFAAEPGNSYHRRDLVSDGGVPAERLDPSLIDCWGLAANPNGPWWVNAIDTDRSLLYNGEGVKNPLVVAVAGEPTGIVFSGSASFVIPSVGPARFIFARKDGTIAAWSPLLVPNTQSVAMVDNSAAGASYTGLAIDSISAGTRLFAADFHNARVDVFAGDFTPLTVAGGFTDPDLPAGYAPFGIQTLAGSVYVTYALQDEEGEAVAGSGRGIVNKFDFEGRLIARVAQGDALNAPWGLALAPAGFGRFSGRLLVGNFGNGRINVFDAVTFEPKGHLKGTKGGKAIVIDGLRGISFGTGGIAGPVNTLFFSAGPDDGAHGLFGRLDAQ